MRIGIKSCRLGIITVTDKSVMKEMNTFKMVKIIVDDPEQKNPM